MDELLNKLAHWKPIRALVVGDFMLDQLVYGDAERLTNDAPVPVLTARRTVETPGGAANVCMDLVAMHAEVRCFGVMGDDREADLLSKALADSAIDTAGLVRDPSRPTTVKRNLIGLAQHRHPQKMFRVDFESRKPLADKIVDRIVEAFTRALPDADVVAIEDYNKGVCCPNLCRRIIEAAREAGKPILIDPASIDDYTKYAGCTAITPNRTEAERATGLTTLTEGNTDKRASHNAALAKRLASQLDCEAVVLTLDRDGALLLERGAEPCAVPTIARQVYDVTGAGDMVLAALMAARANGIDWADSVRFANAAAGLEVEVFGVQPIPFERIYHSVLVQAKDLIGKRRTLDEARIEIEAARREGKKIVFTNGCFDIIHAGHISLLRKAREHGDLLVVGLNSDDSVRRLKGPERPVHDEDDRVTVLSELESVAVVVVFEEDTPLKLIETLRPDVLVKGADYTKDQVVGGDIVESYGGEIALVELLAGRSTTGAIERHPIGLIAMASPTPPTPSTGPETDWNDLSLDDYASRMLASGHVQRLLELCVDEDLGTSGKPGDVTSLLCVPERESDAPVSAHLRSRQTATVAGLAFVPAICQTFARGDVIWQPAIADGTRVEPGALLGQLSGPRAGVLAIERTMLNLVSRLSGIATITGRYIDAIRDAGVDPDRVRLLDTRKTTPGHRLIEKYAVRCGGGYSHRIGLYDAVLVKDNHIAMATGGLEGILNELKTARDRFTLQFVEVEVDSLEQFETILAAEQASPGLVDIVLLDNMPPDTLREAVARRDRAGSRILLEASGGITLETIGVVALTGVDRISTGAITHQARSVDFGLDAG